MSTHQDLSDLSNAFRYALAARGELNIIQTSHFAAIDTKKMGVCRIVPMLADSDRFESPDVVSQFRPSQQTVRRQISSATAWTSIPEPFATCKRIACAVR